MEKVFIKLVVLFSAPLLVALCTTAAYVYPPKCLEMIGSQPKSFSGKQNLRFEPSVLPKFNAHSSGISISFKMYIQAFTSGWGTVFHGSSAKKTFYTPVMWLYPKNSRVYLGLATSVSKSESATSSANLFNRNQWYHVSYVLNNQKLLLYVNGKVVMNRPITAGRKVLYPDGTRPFFIGFDEVYGSFTGQLKSFRYCNFGFSQTQVNQDKSSLKPITAIGGSGNNAGGSSPVKGKGLQMIGSKPMSFEGNKNLVIKPNLLPKFGSTHTKGLSVTFKIMVRKYSKGCWNVIFHGGVDPFRTPALWLNPSNTRIYAAVSTSASMNEGGYSAGNAFTLNKWHHAAYVLTNKKLLFYVDSKVVMTRVLKGKVKYSDGTHPFYIGHDTQHYSFDGELQFFRFYDFALTPDEVTKDRSSKQPITKPGSNCCPCQKSG